MSFEESVLKQANELIMALLLKGHLEKKTDPTVFRYYYDPEVRQVLRDIYETSYKIKIIDAEDTIYLMPELENEVFSYSNQELREKMKLENNKELYTAQFIFITLLSEFYGNEYQYTNTPKSFVKIEDILKKVNDYITNFSGLSEEEMYEQSIDYDMDLAGMVSCWQSKKAMTDDVKDTRRARKRDYGFVQAVIRFWEEEKLVVVRDSEEVSLTPKMQQMAGTYYHHEERINKIKQLLEAVTPIKPKEAI